MLNLSNISIRNKLVWMQVFTSVTVLAIFFLAYILTDIRDYKERKAKNVTSLAHVIGTNSASAMLFQDNETAREILSTLKDVAPEIVRAEILDNNNNFFAGYVRPGWNGADTGLAKRRNPVTFTNDFLFVTDDIVNNQELIGRVSLAVELSELSAIKKSKFSMAAILLVAALCISFLIAMAVQPYISKRLLNLVKIIKNTGRSGNYNTPISDHGKDEISILIKTFNNLMKAVNESQQRKDEFIGIASHELKTPLTSIKGYLDLLNGMEDKEVNRQCVQKALESTHKLEKLIKDLLDVSKIQSGQLQLNPVPFSTDELISEVVASMQMVTHTHQIMHQTAAPHNGLVYADKEKIEQVLLNLLSNAVKYSPPETSIWVSSITTNDEVTIRVRDFGPGIPDDELSEIFERFYRTKNSSVHISGLGLGLYICRDIIQRHGGRIWAENEGNGTSFYFSLPAGTNKSNINELSTQKSVNTQIKRIL